MNKMSSPRSEAFGAVVEKLSDTLGGVVSAAEIEALLPAFVAPEQGRGRR